jgi:hypothetical protein
MENFFELIGAPGFAAATVLMEIMRALQKKDVLSTAELAAIFDASAASARKVGQPSVESIAKSAQLIERCIRDIRKEILEAPGTPSTFV